MPRSATRAFGVAVLLLCTVAGCTHAEDSARKTLAQIEGERAAIAAQAARYAPEHLAAADESLAALEAAFERKDYEKVAASGPAVLARVRSLSQRVATNRQNAQSAEWYELSETVPRALRTAEHRLANSSARAERPLALQEAQRLWERALIARASGDIGASVAHARDADALVAAVAASFGSGAAASP